MNPCNFIQGKLVSGENLTGEENQHLAACEDCRSLLSTQQAVELAAGAHRDLDDPSPREIHDLASRLDEQSRPRVRFQRTVWASAVVLMAAIVLVASLTGPWNGTKSDDTEDKLFALMDEVGEIASPSPESDFNEEDTLALEAVSLLFNEEDTGESPDLTMPGSYQLLEEALENTWL